MPEYPERDSGPDVEGKVKLVVAALDMAGGLTETDYGELRPALALFDSLARLEAGMRRVQLQQRAGFAFGAPDGDGSRVVLLEWWPRALGDGFTAPMAPLMLPKREKTPCST